MSHPSVQHCLAHPSFTHLPAALSTLSAHQQFLLLCLPAAGQSHVLQHAGISGPSAPAMSLPAALCELAETLQRVETFYDGIGGVLGYQLKSLQLIRDASGSGSVSQSGSSAAAGSGSDGSASVPAVAAGVGPAGSVGEARYLVPHAVDLAGEFGRQEGRSATLKGLAAMPFLAEIYPVGGAGDRLGLRDDVTGEALPAAMLPYCGRTMMEGLIRDLQAREYLYYKLTGVQLTTPVAVMTSDAKGNHTRMSALMERLDWMGRGREAFTLFRQPLVPVISVTDGLWLLDTPLHPTLKPGGHGAIWKLMWDEGVFEWLAQAGAQAALVRQISNPLAGTDTTMLALAGSGFEKRRAFGFMSCERAVGAAEGMNVLQEQRVSRGEGQGR
ncbi:MAG: hypothetical protein WDW38_006278 [Sanguina aurantia]